MNKYPNWPIALKNKPMKNRQIKNDDVIVIVPACCCHFKRFHSRNAKPASSLDERPVFIISVRLKETGVFSFCFCFSVGALWRRTLESRDNGNF